MKSQRGYILIATLIVMQLCVLLGLDAIEASWTGNKSGFLISQKYQIVSGVDQIMRQIEGEAVTQDSECIISTIPTDKLVNKSRSWWDEQSCAGNFQSIQYYYVLESLGIDPCAHVENKEQGVAGYYRLTLWVVNRQGESQLMVQTSYIQTVFVSDKCYSNMHKVKVGRQSWQILRNERKNINGD